MRGSMKFLSTKNEEGIFTYKQISRRIRTFVEYGYFPTLEESWKYETELISNNHQFDIHKRPGSKEEFRIRIYNPSMQEALARWSIKNYSNAFDLLEVTDDEDWNGKIDLKVKPFCFDDETIIQVKSSIPDFKKIVYKELWPQLKMFGKTAEYLIVRFSELNFQNCELVYAKENGEISIYKPEQTDIMLTEMRKEQIRKYEQNSHDGKIC